MKLVDGKYQENVIMTAENGGETKKYDWTRRGSLLVQKKLLAYQTLS